MKKIRLTENQLIDLIKKSINEVNTTSGTQNINETKYVALNPAFGNSAKAVATLMGGDVTSKKLQSIKAELEKWQGVFWEADGRCAIEKFLEYYTQYAKGLNTGKSKTLEADIADATEPGDAMFNDYKQEIYTLIKKMRQQCVDIDNKEKADAKAAKEVLNACASKEPGYVDQGDNFGLAFGKKGYIIGHKTGAQTDGYNLWYWEYKKFHPNKKVDTVDVPIARTNGRCVNGVLDIDAWVKY